MDSLTQYQNVLTDLIKKQMLMLGPNVALGQAKRVEGLMVDNEGNVTEIKGDPQAVLASVAKQYMALSGQIAQMTLESLVKKYPDVKISTGKEL